MLRAPVALLFAACGASLPEVVDPREVADASAAPTLDAIVDLGGRAAKLPGPLGGETPGDGVAAIGELLWLRGSDFGRLPAVTVGGRPAAIEAFTDDGIVVRVPPGSAAGEQAVAVEHRHGRSARRFPIRRWGLVAAGGSAVALETDGTGVRVATRIAAAGVRDLRYSADGSVAYLLGERLTIVDMAARRGPRVAGERDLPLVAEHLAVARGPGSSRAALVSRDAIAMIDVSDAYRPAFWAKRAMPAVTAVAAELDAAGRLLALLHGNTATFVDVSDVAAPKPGATVDLAPGVGAPLGTRVRHVGTSFWALLGGNPQSAATGVRPVRLVRVQDGRADANLEISPSGEAVALAPAAETRRVTGSTLHAFAMAPMLVAANAGGQGTVFRIDGSGAAARWRTSETLLAMDGGGGTVIGVVCRDGRLAAASGGDGVVDLGTPCPSGPVAVAVQP